MALSQLRILIVEDSEDDTLVMLDVLRANSYQPIFERVDTAVDMKTALQECWDIVICDYLMPGFSGISALKLLQSTGQDIPFVIVSGILDEQIAVDALKAGAHDFVLKSRMTRLVPAIERELREVKIRQHYRAVEAALKQNEARYRSLTLATSQAVWIASAEGQVIEDIPSWRSLTGQSEADVKGWGWLDAVHPEDRARTAKNWTEAIRTKSFYQIEYRMRVADGNYRDFAVRGVPIIDDNGAIREWVGTNTDISEVKQQERKIRAQAALLDVATDAIVVMGKLQTILFWNKGAEVLYQWQGQEVIGKQAGEVLYKDVSQLAQALDTTIAVGEWQGELNQIGKHGKKIIVQSRWTLVRDEQQQPQSILTVSTDITEKKQLEAQFLRAQRLESIGILASGIAHDLNNILTPILLSVQLMQLQTHEPSNQQLLRAIEANTKRGANLVKQVLAFARGGGGDRTTVYIAPLIAEIEDIAHKTFPKSIDLVTDIAPELWATAAEATQLHQVLMNLLVNSRDAMPSGGTLIIRAENISVDDRHAKLNIDAKVGAYIAITVADTGVGIAPEILEKVFEPFFTTKEVGKGTGLGLSTAIGIIKIYGGFVNLYSEVGKGTEFKVYLPAAPAPEILTAPETTIT
jgi:PAS domain S-box-containing protein